MNRPSDSGSSDRARQGLWRLMLKLPAMRGRLQILAAQSLVLNELCEAYEDASLALERLSIQRDLASAERLTEYRTLCTDIETDVVHLVLQQSRNEPN